MNPQLDRFLPLRKKSIVSKVDSIASEIPNAQQTFAVQAERRI